MRGIPRNIQTPEDLNLLFEVLTKGKEAKATIKAAKTNPRSRMVQIAPQILNLAAAYDDTFPKGQPESTSELEICLRRLLGQQYHRARIVSVDGKKVTTLYFPEIEKASKTEDGRNIIKFEHIKALEDSELGIDGGEIYEFTETTLSAAPSDLMWLSVHMPDNHLTRMGLDSKKIEELLEVLTNA